MIKVFNKRLLEQMQACQIDEFELSSLLNVSVRQVKRWMSGCEMPTINMLESICKVLNSNPNYMLGFGEAPCELASGVRDMDLFNLFIELCLCKASGKFE